MINMFSLELWIIIGLIALILELCSNTFYLLSISLAAFCTAIVNYYYYDSTMQIIVFIITAVVFILLSRILATRLDKTDVRKANCERLLGLNAKVIRPLNDGRYTVMVSNEVWPATSNDSLDLYDNVVVTSVQSTTLGVKKIKK